MKIRGHHLLCMEGFQGYGYSGEFTENMAEVVDEYKSNSEVEVIQGVDVICQFCPFQVEGECKKVKDVMAFDLEVLKVLGLNPGDRMRREEVAPIIWTMRAINGVMAEYCQKCEWKVVCALQAKEKRNDSRRAI